MKVVLLTSDSLRHNYIAASLAKELDLTLVITESKASNLQDTSSYKPEDARFLAAHFKARVASEEKFFGEYRGFLMEIPMIQVAHGRINSKEVFKTIDEAAPDVVVLFGTSIIKEPLLSRFRNQIINLHLGVSPYYRGSATNLYPYLFEEPECVGATIHLASNEVDKGAILHQLRPDIIESDDLHDIGNKVIKKAGEVLPEVLKAYRSGKIEPVPQTGSGKICLNRDITPDVVRDIYKNFEQGMIPHYLSHKKIRDAAKPIVEQKPDSEHNSD